MAEQTAFVTGANNAGVGLKRVPSSELTVSALQKTIESSVFGLFRVTKALLQLLMGSGSRKSMQSKEMQARVT